MPHPSLRRADSEVVHPLAEEVVSVVVDSAVEAVNQKVCLQVIPISSTLVE